MGSRGRLSSADSRITDSDKHYYVGRVVRDTMNDDKEFPGEIGVGWMPGRKRPALWVRNGGAVRVLAFFNNQEAMNEYLSYEPTFIPRIFI